MWHIGVIIVLSIIIFFVFIFVIWRIASQYYTIPCPSWLSWMVEMDNPFTKVNRAATIIEHLQLKPGMKVLDIGCGPGRLTLPIAKAIAPTGTVYAMDIQQKMLEKVQHKARKQHIQNITYLHAGIGMHTLPENAFDRVLLVTVLGEIPHRLEAFKEIYYTLKPGGILSLTEIIFDPHFQRQSTVIHLASAVGLKKIALYGNRIAYTMHLQK